MRFRNGVRFRRAPFSFESKIVPQSRVHRWRWVMLACLGFGLSNTPRAAAQAAGSIAGQVFVSPGREIPSPVLVTVTSHGAVVYSSYTDAEGHFGVNSLPA